MWKFKIKLHNQLTANRDVAWTLGYDKQTTAWKNPQNEWLVSLRERVTFGTTSASRKSTHHNKPLAPLKPSFFLLFRCLVSQFCNPVICTFHKKLKPKASSGRIFALDPVTTLRRVSHPMELLYQQFVHLHTTSLTDYQARHAYQYYTHRTMEGRAKVSHQAQVPWSVVTGDWGQRGKASRRIAWLEIWPKVRSKKMLTGYPLKYPQMLASNSWTYTSLTGARMVDLESRRSQLFCTTNDLFEEFHAQPFLDPPYDPTSSWEALGPLNMLYSAFYFRTRYLDGISPPVIRRLASRSHLAVCPSIVHTSAYACWRLPTSLRHCEAGSNTLDGCSTCEYNGVTTG